MKKIYIINVPQVGSYNTVSIDIYTTGTTLPVSENNNVDYNALTAEQKQQIDDFINMMYSKIPS